MEILHKIIQLLLVTAEGTCIRSLLDSLDIGALMKNTDVAHFRDDNILNAAFPYKI